MQSQSTLVNATRQHDAKTANGAVTHSTSLNSILDLYFIAGASRKMSEESITKMFVASLAENTLLTMKLLFWARDIREGAGERRFFNICLKYLKNSKPELLMKNAHLISEYGRWDDILELITINSNDDLTKMSLDLISDGLKSKNGLLSKWLPRKGDLANFLRKSFKQTPKEYRKTLVELSNTIEQKMCSNDWTAIDYSHVPSISMNKYRTAFYRKDGERFKSFIEAVTKGEVKINASVIYPHQLYQAWHRKGQDAKAIEAQWYAMPNYLKGSTQRILPVCDVSSSMFSDVAIDMSVSLGLYISERNEGIFKDAFITFAERPQMVYLKGTFVEKLVQLRNSPWGGSTNIQATFEMILEKAVTHKLSENDMPTTLLIISDMEFNSAGKKTNLEAIRKQFEKSGYTMPNLVFWNVRAREKNVPANAHDKGVGLVSGASPNTIEAVLQGDSFTPVGLMLKKLNSDRYKNIMV